MRLKTAAYGAGGGGSATSSVKRVGNDIEVSVTFDNGYSSVGHKCTLGVEVDHDEDNSDSTLKQYPRKYDSATGDYTGNTTLAVPQQVPDCLGTCTDNTKYAKTLTLRVTPSSFPHRYEDNSGAKLHVGRLGVTLKPFVQCFGLSANQQQNQKIYLEDFHATEKGTTGQTAHPFFYDLVADGTSLKSTDTAAAPVGEFKSSEDNGKRLFDYTTAFSHFHDQVRFPDTAGSIESKPASAHFDSVPVPANAECRWHHGTFVNGINYDGAAPTLREQGWMTQKDTAKPSAAYSDWAAADCAGNICKKYQKVATVASASAYLPFDKPLPEYYDNDAPKIQCKSQKDDVSANVVGTLANSEVTPDLLTDSQSSPSIFTSVVTKFKSLANRPCPNKNGANSDICVVTEDQNKVKGELFVYSRHEQDFTNLLTDQYDFRASFTCVSSRSSGDDCSVSPGADSEVKLLTTLKRSDDNGKSLADQLVDKAAAVESIEFDLPQLYGTTFSTFEASISGLSATGNTNKYRTRGDFAVTMLLLSTEDTAGQEAIQWTGGAKVDAKDFQGFNTTTRFVERTQKILTQTRVKAAALAGYYTANATFAAIVQDGSTVGIMSPFNDVGDLAVSANAAEADKLAGKDDDLTREMSAANPYWAVKSHCCGIVGNNALGGDCDAMNVAGNAAAAGASVYCRTNGFAAVRCLSSKLDVEYKVTTQTLDDRFGEDQKTATKTYVEAATPSKTQTEQAFVVVNAPYSAVTVAAGAQAGTDKHTYNISTAFMGTAAAEFDRTTDGEDVTYNCESEGRDITYDVLLHTPCGESHLNLNDANYMPQYALSATVKAHYVYTNGEGGTTDQVSQTVTTASMEGYTEHNGAVKENNTWLTTEWRVQDSSAENSAAKGSGTPIDLKIVISNDQTKGSYDADLHMPEDKVFVIDDATLKVVGEGQVSLKECVTTASERYCILQYRNDNVFSVDAGKRCNEDGQPECPVIEYTIGAKVKSGNLANAFGEAAACGVPAGAVATTRIGDKRSHTLVVLGNRRAYDGVLDIHVTEKDPACTRYCENAGHPFDPDDDSTWCTTTAFGNANTDFLQPTTNQGNTYCRNPYRLATETLHDVAVPGKDGAATTILDPISKGQITSSKDLTFEVRYFRIGTGPRRFTIRGLDVPPSLKNAGLPKPLVCSKQQYASINGCVKAGQTTDEGNFEQVVDHMYNDRNESNIGTFYLALGNDKTIDVCSKTNVDDDPYTITDENNNKQLTLGFAIKVNYLTFGGDTGSGDPDNDVEHKFYFQLACPQKAYSMDIVKFDGDENDVRKNIPAGVDIGLVDKSVYADSHFKFMTIKTYFNGRSTARYDADDENKNGGCLDTDTSASCHKAPISMKLNDNARFKGGAQKVFLDTADTYDTAQELEFEFYRPCLFTTITLISKVTPLDGNGDYITGTAGDTEFSFRVQCPRWREDASSDALNLHYDVKDTTFTETGGSVTVTQPALNQTGMVNPFKKIETSLRQNLCDGQVIENQDCIFPIVDPGEDSKLEKTGTQQSWLKFLASCGFTQDNAQGNYVGFMQREYTRDNIGKVQGESDLGEQKYCSGRQLSFGIETKGTHTATIRVDAPLEMDFAVQLDKLEWSQAGCDANKNEYKMVAEATLYRREFTSARNGVWYTATASLLTDITLNNAFFGNVNDFSDIMTVTNGKISINGKCKELADEDNDCADFEKEREVDFGAVYTQFGVDYRANLGIDFQMTCPRGTRIGSDTGKVALRHDTACSDYKAASMTEEKCGTDGIDGDNNAIYTVTADGQIQLTLVIDDTAFLDHTVSAPRYKIINADDSFTEGLVTDLCDASQTDCVYRANDGTADIPLVAERTYPTDPVVIKGQQYDFSARDPEENSVVTLRALPLSDTTVEISWVVERVLTNNNTNARRLRAMYTFGANFANNGADKVGFKVLPATREEEAGIASQDSELVAEETQATQQTEASHADGDDDDEDDDSSMATTIIVVLVSIVGAVALLMVVRSKAEKKKKAAGTGSSTSSDNFKSRFYQYSMLKNDDEKMFRKSRFL
ncbi:MAG: hypothetical protein CMF51_02290 [Legionellales bacterium]|nr:hypothetical protein [Legionellales bacterium]